MTNLTLQHSIQVFAEGAIEHAKTCGVFLDGTPASVQQVEAILDFMHNLTKEQVTPSEQQFTDFANGYGAYIGEVIRRSFGGDWLIFRDETSPLDGATALKTNGVFIFPPARVYWRLTQGIENDVWNYFLTLQEKFSGEAQKHL